MTIEELEKLSVRELMTLLETVRADEKILLTIIRAKVYGK
jgi:hypothetical protein